MLKFKSFFLKHYYLALLRISSCCIWHRKKQTFVSQKLQIFFFHFYALVSTDEGGLSVQLSIFLSTNIKLSLTSNLHQVHCTVFIFSVHISWVKHIHMTSAYEVRDGPLTLIQDDTKGDMVFLKHILFHVKILM